MFTARTVQDILEHVEADTEVLVGLDGQWSNPGIPQHDRVTIVYYPESIGQRAMTNKLALLAKGKYVMKVDAHCAFDQGFDRKMLEAFKEVGDDVTLVPTMKNLWAFDWKCDSCDWTKYQGPTPEKCEKCGGTVSRDMKWIGKPRPNSNSYCFDSEPHFQYFNAYTKRPEVRKQVAETGYSETMSLQGSCFMATKEKYFELKLCDADLGNWGNQGIEVAVKTWLSGGRVLVNHKTWYAHMFRTQGGDFGFPYKLSGNEVARTKEKVKDLFFNNKWDKQVRKLSWLLERFWPVSGWTEEQLIELKAKENG